MWITGVVISVIIIGEGSNNNLLHTDCQTQVLTLGFFKFLALCAVGCGALFPSFFHHHKVIELVMVMNIDNVWSYRSHVWFCWFLTSICRNIWQMIKKLLSWHWNVDLCSVLPAFYFLHVKIGVKHSLQSLFLFFFPNILIVLLCHVADTKWNTGIYKI